MSVTYIPATLRKLVTTRANNSCEYCLISEEVSFATHQVDHIIAEKHGGLTIESNLALSCAPCNKRKGSDIASVDDETGMVVPLFNPRTQIWREHFRIDYFYFVGLTPEGKATIKFLQLNNAARVEERRILELFKS